LLHLAKTISCGSSNNRAQRFSRPPALSSRGQPAGLLHQVPPGEERCLTNSTGTPYSKNFVQSPKTRLEPSYQLAKLCSLVCHTLCSGNLTADVGLYPSDRASEFPAFRPVYIEAAVQYCSLAANREQRRRLMSGVSSNLTTGVAAIGLLRLSCEKPNMVISPLRCLHMFSMCRCTQKLGGSPVICQVGSIAGLPCSYELHFVSSCMHLATCFSD